MFGADEFVQFSFAGIKSKDGADLEIVLLIRCVFIGILGKSKFIFFKAKKIAEADDLIGCQAISGNDGFGCRQFGIIKSSILDGFPGG